MPLELLIVRIADNISADMFCHLVFCAIWRHDRVLLAKGNDLLSVLVSGWLKTPVVVDARGRHL